MNLAAGRRFNVKHRVIRGTQGKPLPLLPSGPGGVCSRLLHGARHLTTSQFSRRRKCECWAAGRSCTTIRKIS